MPAPSSTPLYAFIMAGGSGERFWPMSRSRTPKHLLRLLSDRTLLEEAIRRLEGIVPAERTFVLTNTVQMDASRAAVPFLPPENFIAEPAKRDTAPAAALATAIAHSRTPDAVCVLLPADSMIHDTTAFQRNLRDAVTTAAKGGALLTFAIKPTYAATGFGYLELGRDLDPGSGGTRIRQVNRFVEKPAPDTAEEYVAGGNHGWNAGMFLWRSCTFLDECDRLNPPLAAFIRDFPRGDFNPFLTERFPSLPKISVDYAIMEQASHVIAAAAEFDWDDVGTWTALPAHFGKDENQNTLRGPSVVLDSYHNIVVANARTIALCGVSNLVVVETEDALLVCHRDAVQKIKSLQPRLPEALR